MFCPSDRFPIPTVSPQSSSSISAVGLSRIGQANSGIPNKIEIVSCRHRLDACYLISIWGNLRGLATWVLASNAVVLDVVLIRGINEQINYQTVILTW